MEPERFAVASSRDGVELKCYRIVPEGRPKATFQMIHGMTEHILRYRELAEFLLDRGYAVYGHDQLGHGNTSSDDLGYIADRNGDDHLVEDVHIVCGRVRSDYPDIPHFVFGHSMGSLVMRRYIADHGDEVDGAVLMGTGQVGASKYGMALTVINVLSKLRGGHGHSPFLDKAVFDDYNKGIPPEEGPFRWLSRDMEATKGYEDDPYCGFRFTLSAYGDLMTLLKKLDEERNFDRIPKGLRTLFISGGEDPFGEFGKGVREVAKTLEGYGLKPDVMIYDGARHSLIDELNRRQVFSDIADWLDSNTS